MARSQRPGISKGKVWVSPEGSKGLSCKEAVWKYTEGAWQESPEVLKGIQASCQADKVKKQVSNAKNRE